MDPAEEGTEPEGFGQHFPGSGSQTHVRHWGRGTHGLSCGSQNHPLCLSSSGAPTHGPSQASGIWTPQLDRQGALGNVSAPLSKPQARRHLGPPRFSLGSGPAPLYRAPGEGVDFRVVPPSEYPAVQALVTLSCKARHVLVRAEAPLPLRCFLLLEEWRPAHKAPALQPVVAGKPGLPPKQFPASALPGAGANVPAVQQRPSPEGPTKAGQLIGLCVGAQSRWQD